MAKKKEDSEGYYIGIKEPVGLRRALLESTRDVVIILRSLEKIKELRKIRNEESHRLKFLVKGITNDINRLKTELPKVKFLHVPKVKKSRVKEIIETVKEDKELSKFESELNAIESKLGRL